MDRGLGLKLVAIGVTAGIAAGLFGIGGGVVMVPLLVLWCGFKQHDAHVNSLAAGIMLGLSGAITYGLAGEVDFGVAAALAAGALVGTQIGARVMQRASEGRLEAAFGALLLAAAVALVLT